MVANPSLGHTQKRAAAAPDRLSEPGPLYCIAVWPGLSTTLKGVQNRETVTESPDCTAQTYFTQPGNPETFATQQ